MDLSKLITFNLDEYVDKNGKLIPMTHKLSYRRYMKEKFFDLVSERGVRKENVHFPDVDNLENYSKKIYEVGGIDLQLLGIGFNGHIAFNEPPPPSVEISLEEFQNFSTRIVDLDELTIITNANLTANGERSVVPTKAVTMGMREILNAKQILLLACFKEQSEILKKTILGPITPYIPASFLQKHPNCKFIVTKDAAPKLD